MLNSQTYMREEGVLNTGEVIAPDYNLKDPNVKVYYHQVKGACTHMPDGAMIQFTGGVYATANKEIIAFLDKIADKRGTQVYTKKNDAIVEELAQVAEDAKAPAGDAAQINKPISPETKATVTAPAVKPVPLPNQAA